MDTSVAPKSLKLGKFSLLMAILAAIVLLLYLLTPNDASEEYKYTVEKIFQFGFIPLFLLSLLCFYFSIRQIRFGKMLESRYGWLVTGIAGAVFMAIPYYSPVAAQLDWRLGLGLSICWVLACLLVSLALFLLAARLDNTVSGLLCFIASLFLAYFLGEFAYLITPQVNDGKWYDSVHSKYVLSGLATPRSPEKDTMFGSFPCRPDNPAGASARRELRYGRESFDALYTLDENNRRITPASDPVPKADLLLFGCSFTFGFGMNDNQTWPWLLGEKLGPSWRIENYAYNGFGAHQMLTILREKLFTPPTAPVRQALFLAIHDQIRRNSGFFARNSVSYKNVNGELVRGPMTDDSPWQALFTWPERLNGSQLAREISHKVLTYFVEKNEKEHTETYLAIIIECARILRDDYGTTLTVLLWPDIAYLKDALAASGIQTLLASDMLPEWEASHGTVYQIVPVYETHPNTRAAAELAEGLFKYYHGIEEAATAGNN